MTKEQSWSSVSVSQIYASKTHRITSTMEDLGLFALRHEQHRIEGRQSIAP